MEGWAGGPLTFRPPGHAYVVSDKRDEEQKVLAQLEELSRQRYVSSLEIAGIYTGLGEKDQAFAWLQKACEERAYRLTSLPVAPEFDTLRSDPRFTDLLRCVRLAP